jgi:NAD(P)-dependent dehydrogenase (short-subunit alcohol dehydrogenase family)
LPYMEQQGSGHVVNAYGAGDPKVMGIGACVYGVSKDAIRSFTAYVAEEEREFNIPVVIVVPGAAIWTEETPPDTRGTRAHQGTGIPGQRLRPRRASGHGPHRQSAQAQGRRTHRRLSEFLMFK